jgi:hypothetical protein
MRQLLFTAGALALCVACVPGEKVIDTSLDTAVTMPVGALSGEAIVLPDCAPWDGPAYELRLMLDSPVCDAPPPATYVAVDVYRTDLAAGDVVDLADFNEGAAASHSGGGVAWVVSGTLTIDAWRDGDDLARGEVQIVFDDGSEVAGSFEADAGCLDVVDQPMCG